MSLPEVIHASHPSMDVQRTHTQTHMKEKREVGKARGNEREGEIENERRKRENKHVPNRLAIEREGKKREERERKLCPRKNTRK